MFKRKIDSEPNHGRPKRPKYEGGPCTDSEVPAANPARGASIDISMVVSPRESEQPDFDPFCQGSLNIPIHEQHPQASNSMVCDAETEERSQPMHGRPATPISFLSQEQGTTQHENGLTALASEVRALAVTLRDEYAELERKLNAQMDAVMLKVTHKIDSIEHTVIRRFGEQPPQTLGHGAVPVHGGHDNFKFLVRYHANELLYPRALPLSPLGLDVPSISEVLDFAKGPHIGPAIARFRIDPASRPSSPWNLRACHVFAEDFCAKRHPEAEGKTIMDVLWEFYSLIPEFSTQHALASGFASSSSYGRFQESLRRRIRRHRLAESRLSLVSEVQDLRGFLPVVRHLAEEDGMSSDEQDIDDDRNLHSSRPFWRHPSITDWLHGIDSIGASREASGDTTQNGYKRQPSSKVDGESRVVKGLPINFYDWGYLDGLDRPQYLNLDPKPALSLEFSASIQQILRGPHV